MKKIFLSHNSKDKPFVRRLGQAFSRYGVKTWIDEGEIKVGQSLIEKISNGIVESDYFGIILSKNSIQSEWVNKELKIALHKEIKEKKLSILPILLDDVDLPPFLWDKLNVRFSDDKNFENQFFKLIDAMDITIADIKDIANQSFQWHELKHKIEIKDPSGKVATWTKETIATPIRNDIYFWFDEQLHGSGDLEVLGTNIGHVYEVREEGGVYMVTTEFSEPLPMQRIAKQVHLELSDCFVENAESISWILNSQMEYLTFELSLPKSRPFLGEPRMFGYYGASRVRVQNCELKYDENTLTARVMEPEKGIKYLLEWDW